MPTSLILPRAMSRLRPPLFPPISTRYFCTRDDDSAPPKPKSKAKPKAPKDAVHNALKTMTIGPKLARPSKLRDTYDRLKTGGEQEDKLDRTDPKRVTPEGILGPEMVGAAKSAAEKVARDSSSVESNLKELVDKLVEAEVDTYKAARVPVSESGGVNPLNVISDMKVDQSKKNKFAKASRKPRKDEEGPEDERVTHLRSRLSRRRMPDLSDDAVRKAAGPVRRVMKPWDTDEDGTDRDQRRKPRREDRHEPMPELGRTEMIKLFGGEPLGIFKNHREWPEGEAEVPSLKFWNHLDKERLKRLTQQPPRNAWEELIQWTDEGKLWHYPIDNEWRSEEKDIGFQEHVFLETHLERGFPKSGPIRDFMELVCIGLSKNPYMPLWRKHEHIDWFRTFFAEKQAEIERLQEREKKREEKLQAQISS